VLPDVLLQHGHALRVSGLFLGTHLQPVPVDVLLVGIGKRDGWIDAPKQLLVLFADEQLGEFGGVCDGLELAGAENFKVLLRRNQPLCEKVPGHLQPPRHGVGDGGADGALGH
jgi:hypothetical protein